MTTVKVSYSLIQETRTTKEIIKEIGSPKSLISQARTPPIVKESRIKAIVKARAKVITKGRKPTKRSRCYRAHVNGIPQRPSRQGLKGSMEQPRQSR